VNIVSEQHVTTDDWMYEADELKFMSNIFLSVFEEACGYFDVFLHAAINCDF
jgi:hypothetical protein